MTNPTEQDAERRHAEWLDSEDDADRDEALSGPATLTEQNAYRVDLTVTCDQCRTALEIHGQAGPGPLKAYADFADQHTH